MHALRCVCVCVCVRPRYTQGCTEELLDVTGAAESTEDNLEESRQMERLAPGRLGTKLQLASVGRGLRRRGRRPEKLRNTTKL